MSVQKVSLFWNILKPSLVQIQTRSLHKGKPKLVAEALKYNSSSPVPAITSALPAPHNTAKLIFDNSQTADFKYIWLRDNCRCPECIHTGTNQKLVDTHAIDVNIKPKSLFINTEGNLQVTWDEKQGEHVSIFNTQWLHKYGQSFIHNTFDGDNVDKDHQVRPEYSLWDRTTIWSHFPEVSYNEFMESEEGLRTWLELFYKYGVAFLRGVPTTDKKILDVAKRIAYVKETQYGAYFDVINKPMKGEHLAYSGLYLAHHTDMNYREKSPGMQMLHCLKANDPKKTGVDSGGRSFFVDGFRVAKWLEDNKPAAFHVLTSTPVRFSIKNDGMTYSALWPLICLDGEGNVCEIHYNNRTMKPLQAPTQVITPFYYAYKVLSDKLRDPANNLELHMLPGDLVAFNNRRALHGRTSYDPSITERHLQGCYLDIDEAFSKFDQLQSKHEKKH